MELQELISPHGKRFHLQILVLIRQGLFLEQLLAGMLLLKELTQLVQLQQFIQQ